MNFASQSLVTAARNTFHIFSPIHHLKSSPLETHHRVMSTFQAVPARGSTPAYSVFSKPIEKSPQDDRDYRIIKLANGLNATVVHDPTADKAAASLDVAVGHLSDPDDMPGLAHFCEHLLFMGTEQYPKENDYSEFLAKNNGGSNAYTSSSNTNYHFSVATPALVPALSRFAAFFHSPLFSSSCTSRELNAVDSEHKKNHQNDIWRIFQLNKYLTKDGHVWSKFGTGNRETLSRAGKALKAKGKLNGIASPTALMPNLNGNATHRILSEHSGLAPSPISSRMSSLAPSPIPSRMSSPAPSAVSTASDADADGGAVGRETRRRLVEWWSKEYCASRMNLCVVGKESLDELSDLVSTLFSPILNRGQDPLPMIYDHPFGPNETSKLVSVHTIMGFHALEISFPLDYQPLHWRHKPSNFLAHFVGHEGRGSLHSYLKNKGWITLLNAGSQSLGRGFSMFKVTTHLTQAGFQNHRSIMLAVFKYLSLLRSTNFPDWYQREISMMNQTRFRFKEKSKPESFAVWLSSHMEWPVPRELVLKAPQLVWEWDTNDEETGLEKVKKILDSLTVDKGRAVLMAKAEEHRKISVGDAKWQKEPVYGTVFKVDELDEEFIKAAKGPNDLSELFLPGPNEFMPTNLDVEKREVAEPSLRPHLIRETPISTLWHKKDDQFWLPKAHVIIEIRSPFVNTSPKSSVLTRIYTDLVNDALTEFSYDADLAGLEYNFASHSLGLYVTLSGYNDKLAVLARHVLEKAKNIQISPVRLEVIKEQIKRDWDNFFLDQSYRISDYYGRYAISDNLWTIDEKLPEVANVTCDEVQKHIVEILSKFNMRILVTGNFFKDEAISIAEMAERALGTPSPLPYNDVIERALLLPEASNFIWTSTAPNPEEPNSALTYYTYLGPRVEPFERTRANLLTQILSEPAFNILRTQEQLGYIVHCSTWNLPGTGHAGIRIVVQSERGPAYLESRVEAFLEAMKIHIEEMDASAFEEQKSGLERNLTEKVKTVGDETNMFWAHIDSGYLDFMRRSKDVEVLKTITKSDVLDLFLTRMHPSSPTRSKLSVHCLSQKPRPKQISAAAGQAIASLARAAGVAVDDADWREELGSDPAPSIADFEKYWKDVLVEPTVKPEVAQQLLGEIPSIVEKYPAEGDIEDSVKRPNVTYIDDLKAFRATLTKTDTPEPLENWGDLPSSKF